MIIELLDAVPLWGVFVLASAVVLAAIEAGFRYGRFRRQHSGDEKESPVGAMAGAMLGLLALLLTFTFGASASRFEQRRQALLDEANAIGTTYLRAEMLPDEIKTAVQGRLREYVDVRLQAADPSKTAEAIRRSDELHRELWSAATKATAADRSAVTAIFVESLNEVIDLHATRIMLTLRSRIPGSVWLAVYLVTFLSMGVMGYLAGLASPSRSPAVFGLALSFSAVIWLVADLDRPGEGILRVGQQAMIDLQNSIKEDPPSDAGEH